MSNSISGLFSKLFDNKMESFETAFPAKVSKVNSDGTVDIIPSIKNVLRNMQMEPVDLEGNLNPVMGVPVLYSGNSNVIIEIELKKGDPVLCVASSRDLRSWIEGGWVKDGPYDPLSFSGNDLNDLVAIPMRRESHSSTKTRVFIDHDGAISISSEKKLKIESPYIGFKGNLVVDGEIHGTGDVVANCETSPCSLSSHVHASAVGPTAVPNPGATVPVLPIVEPE